MSRKTLAEGSALAHDLNPLGAGAAGVKAGHQEAACVVPTLGAGEGVGGAHGP